ncbi:HAD-IA family hydrolase [Octadecabacter sp. G9-8]|uniref:HAD-IA family hydrolase n=1 Tax=Octadecabacter dasysiphoniae TaxID=2909341 RepID=A0ABS9D2C6_9RHOB|nr:HAD-IA family hydrolase [Octadecabacter dasysiphoniae]MCF2872790.1 HAD-IA family hydrolase [Octadecabacter dasysiphoniae]
MLDVDGVLVFGRPSDGQHWMVGLEKDLGIIPRKISRCFFKAEWNSVLEGRMSLIPALQKALCELGSDISAEEFVSYWFKMSSRIVAPVLSDVRKARKQGIPVYLATNQCHERADHLLNTVGLCKEIDGIVHSAMAGYQKPNAGFYSYGERKTGYCSEELIIVDDNLENVEAAMAVGWQAVHWADGDNLSSILQRSIG